ncbi:unannotated protein [freshwater metagenome]|uniref:Unannotated protein n=1 Tax=freshwater metagenome TaxID=449393 RepID=A0A6J7DKF1_9ZZZZ|nr:hypothetical protein [Actinomycetota bacterium]
MAVRLVVSGVCKRYGPTTILDQIDLIVDAGEVIAPTAESGPVRLRACRVTLGL